MFRGLFGSKDTQSPQPPKNQIEVVCPVCGAAQYEPRLVVSTFCKRCGVHLKIEKKRVIASEVSKAGGKPEALQPTRTPPASSSAVVDSSARNVVAGPRPVTGPLMPMTSGMAPLARVSVPTFAPPPPPPEHLSVDETGELGLGAMMQAAVARVQSPPVHVVEPISAAPKTEPLLSAPAENLEPEIVIEPPPAEEVTHADEAAPEPEFYAPEAPSVGVPTTAPMSVQELMQSGANVAGNPSALQKMRDQGLYRNHHFKEAQCFECNNKFKVGRSSRSANCPACGAYISMEDVELNMPSTQSIKTRGDVMIRKRGHLTASHLFAKDLRCFGLVSANMHCSGDAIFKTSGKILGEVNCRKFIVEKGSDIEFMNDIRAEEIEISSPVKGHFISKGKLTITATGAVDGSVTGRSINIEPGGELNGSMNIVRGQG